MRHPSCITAQNDISVNHIAGLALHTVGVQFLELAYATGHNMEETMTKDRFFDFFLSANLFLRSLNAT